MSSTASPQVISVHELRHSPAAYVGRVFRGEARYTIAAEGEAVAAMGPAVPGLGYAGVTVAELSKSAARVVRKVQDHGPVYVDVEGRHVAQISPLAGPGRTDQEVEAALAVWDYEGGASGGCWLCGGGAGGSGLRRAGAIRDGHSHSLFVR
jgi:antitoxin (DNA-binding transcriptional repressor) of toxin-antitoxin stability system